jgi:hypothetical protein
MFLEMFLTFFSNLERNQYQFCCFDENCQSNKIKSNCNLRNQQFTHPFIATQGHKFNQLWFQSNKLSNRNSNKMHTNRNAHKQKCTQTKTNRQKCIQTEIQWKPLTVIALEGQTDNINWLLALHKQWCGSGPFWSHKANDHYQLVYVISLKNPVWHFYIHPYS